MRRIKLTKGKYAIVDNEDFPYLSRFSWTANGVTPFTRVGDTSILMTSFLVKGKRGHLNVVMHKNKNSLDCRKSNLVVVNDSISSHNKKKIEEKLGVPTTSKYKGVMLVKNGKSAGKWRSRITKNNKRYWLGDFGTETEASIAYNEKARELYGEFAYQNFPKGMNNGI